MLSHVRVHLLYRQLLLFVLDFIRCNVLVVGEACDLLQRLPHTKAKELLTDAFIDVISSLRGSCLYPRRSWQSDLVVNSKRLVNVAPEIPLVEENS